MLLNVNLCSSARRNVSLQPRLIREQKISSLFQTRNILSVCLKRRFFMWHSPPATQSLYSHSRTVCPLGLISVTQSSHFLWIDKEAVTKRSYWSRYGHRVMMWSPDWEIIPAVMLISGSNWCCVRTHHQLDPLPLHYSSIPTFVIWLNVLLISTLVFSPTELDLILISVALYD